MKTLVLLGLAFCVAAQLNRAFAGNGGSTGSITKTGGFVNLVINGDVTIILPGEKETSLQVFGNNTLSRQLRLDYRNDSIIVGSAKKWNLRPDGILYIPVSGLRKIQINSAARVSSAGLLNVPKLDIVINGACEFTVAHTGGVNIRGTDDFEVDQSVETRPQHNYNVRVNNIPVTLK